MYFLNSSRIYTATPCLLKILIALYRPKANFLIKRWFKEAVLQFFNTAGKKNKKNFLQAETLYSKAFEGMIGLIKTGCSYPQTLTMARFWNFWHR